MFPLHWMVLSAKYLSLYYFFCNYHHVVSNSGSFKLTYDHTESIQCLWCWKYVCISQLLTFFVKILPWQFSTIQERLRSVSKIVVFRICLKVLFEKSEKPYNAKNTLLARKIFFWMKITKDSKGTHLGTKKPFLTSKCQKNQRGPLALFVRRWLNNLKLEWRTFSSC